VVVAFAVWAASPMLQAERRVFAGRLSTDNVVTPWFYGHVGRQLATGSSSERLTDFGYPSPMARVREFPSAWDARLVAPLNQWGDWTAGWARIQAAVLLVNGLGAALLARGLGARGVGIVVAGLLAVVCRPVWKDLVMARMNAAFPGLAFATLGLWLLVLRQRADRGSRPRWGLAAITVPVGVLAALVYPPHLALLVPLGVILAARPMLQTRRVHLGLALAVAVGVGLIALPELQDIAAAGTSRTVACSALSCASPLNSVAWDRLFLRAPDAAQGLSDSGAVAATWLVLPLVVFWKRRVEAILATLLVGALAFLSMGPCPSWTAGLRIDLSVLPTALQSLAWRSVCLLEPIHDYNRLLTMALLLAGVLGGVGADRVVRRKRPLGALLALGVAGTAIAGTQWLVLSEALSPDKWHDSQPPTTAVHILQTPDSQRGPVAELPFDRSAQFLSVLWAPQVPRVNPLRSEGPPPGADPFVAWLHALGTGRPILQVPSADAAKASGVRWVYFDPDRCPNAEPGACQRDVASALTGVLGRPVRFGTLRVWSVD